MYKISTTFIKAHLPALTTQKLIEFYAKELQSQGVDSVSLDADKIVFANDLSRIALNKYVSKFAFFPKGFILITETDKEFAVAVNGSLFNIFFTPAVACVIAVVIIFSIVGFDLAIFQSFLFASIFLMVVNYIVLLLRFRRYFSSLKLDIEQIFQIAPNNCH